MQGKLGTGTRCPERRARFVDYRHSGSADLRDRLVRRHLPLARRIAARFARRGVPFDDLVQVASIGLIHAVDRFDPGRGVPFDAFATPTIIGEIKHHFRDRAWDVRVPRRLQDLHRDVNTAIDRLDSRLGRSPTIHEIAAVVDASAEEVLEAIEAGSAFNTSSLATGSLGSRVSDALVTDGDGAGPVTHLPGPIEDPLRVDDPWLVAAVDRLLVGALVAELPERERLILRMRYWDRHSQETIAERMGISQMHVSRLLRRSLRVLRESMDPDE